MGAPGTRRATRRRGGNLNPRTSHLRAVSSCALLRSSDSLKACSELALGRSNHAAVIPLVTPSLFRRTSAGRLSASRSSSLSLAGFPPILRRVGGPCNPQRTRAAPGGFRRRQPMEDRRRLFPSTATGLAASPPTKGAEEWGVFGSPSTTLAADPPRGSSSSPWRRALSKHAHLLPPHLERLLRLRLFRFTDLPARARAAGEGCDASGRSHVAGERW